MDADTKFTIIWGTASIIIGLVGGYFIYKRAKKAEAKQQQSKKEQ